LFIGANIYTKGADRATCLLNQRNIHQAIRANQGLNNKSVGEQIDWDEIFGPEKYLTRYLPLP